MKEINEWTTIEWTKLHVMIPKKLFNELKNQRLLNNIDTLIVQLLTKYLGELK